MSRALDVTIKAIQEYGELEGVYGTYKEQDVAKVVQAAMKEDMACLGFIEFQKDAYFNKMQCMEIKKELNKLSLYENLNMRLLKSIGEAADFAIEYDTFIKFEVEGQYCRNFKIPVGFG